jgi:multiple sugar transport system substrate-binding protein
VDIYLGLTWDHPRGYRALDEAARLANASGALSLRWDRQPLEGFESHSISELCEAYDLVVLDHPHVGEAVEAGCVQALDDLFDAEELAGWHRDTVGQSYASYTFANRQWALPLDAATQVMACRTDLVDGAIPDTWDDVRALAGRKPVALSIAGPHALLSFSSIAVALGELPSQEAGAPFVSRETGLHVLDIMSDIADSMPAQARGLNPIGLLECMAATDQVALCPLVYGYVNYSAPATPGLYPVSFHNAPRSHGAGRRGSTLGGTGIAISRRCNVTRALLNHLRALMSHNVQCRMIPEHDGQPSLRDAWRDADVNAKWGGFYSNTLDTVEDAWVRPRHPGYIAFQSLASATIRDALARKLSHDAAWASIVDAYRRSFEHAPA